MRNKNMASDKDDKRTRSKSPWLSVNIVFLMVFGSSFVTLVYSHVVVWTVSPLLIALILTLLLLIELILIFRGNKLYSSNESYQKAAKAFSYICYFLGMLYLCVGFLSPLQKTQLSFSNSPFILRGFLSETAHHALYAQPENYSSYGNDNAVYVLYDLGCRYCQTAIPVVLKSLSEKEKDNVVFVNYDTEIGHQIAEKYHISKKSTAVVVKGSEYRKYQLANKDALGNIIVNQNAISSIKEAIASI